MERKLTKLLIATGVVVSASVSMLPLTSYAATVGTVAPVNTIYNCGTGKPGTVACDSVSEQDLYEVDEDGNETPAGTGPTVVTVNVDSVLSLDAVSTGNYSDVDNTVDGKAIQVYPDVINEKGALIAKVRSALPYTIMLSAEVPALYSELEDGYSIPARSTLTKGQNGWSIKNLISNEYAAITQTPTVFYDGGPHDESTDTVFPIGVSISANVPRGVYSTDVTVTATVKE